MPSLLRNLTLAVPVLFTNYPQGASLAQLEALFAPEADVVGVNRVGNDYYAFVHLRDGLFWRMKFLQQTAPGSATHHALDESTIRQAMNTLNDDDASISYTGSWLTATSIPTAYGTTYKRTETANDYAEWATPVTTTAVGMRHLSVSNGGMSIVSINGDNTLADLLPTAQDLVTAGTLASTALVANGGTLNPTDRILDFYGSGNDIQTLFTRSLSAGVHTVRVTCTAYKQAASSNTRLYLSGICAYSGTTPAVTASLGATAMAHVADILTLGSAYEIAFQPVPTGGTDSDWIGRRHGYDYEDTFTIEVDGTPQAVADAEGYSGTSLQIVTENRLRHRDTPTEDMANIIYTFTFDNRGMTMNHVITWLKAGVCNVGYLTMYPVNNHLDKGKTFFFSGEPVVLDQDDGNFYATSSGANNGGFIWNANGAEAAYLKINTMQFADNTLSIEDRLLNNLHKFYLQLQGGDTFAINDVWTSEANYRVALFDDGADGALMPYA